MAAFQHRYISYSTKGIERLNLEPGLQSLNEICLDPKWQTKENLQDPSFIQTPRANEIRYFLHQEGAPSSETPKNYRSRFDKEKIISGPMQYLLSLPGKSIRTKVLFGFNQWFHVPAEKLMVINRVVELLHTASLLIDDVQDESKLRRGLPAAHCIFGVAQTINAANHAYFMAQKHLARLDNPEAFTIFTEELLNLHRGQGMDIYWRDCLVCPTEEEYLDMVSDKTGGLFRLGIRLMLAESRKASENSLLLVDLLGIVFQIRDDYQNIWSDAYAGKKGFCEDLTEGKFSFPIIHSIHSDSENLQLFHILKQRTDDDAVKNFAKEYMESKGSSSYCKHRISSLMQQARELVKGMETEMGNSPEVHEILDYLESE